MDIKLVDSHIREYLETKAKPNELASYISLCGPTFDRTFAIKTATKNGKLKDDYVYEIEVTTNRVDAASVIGIAREAAAILPQFGIKASLINLSADMPKLKKGNYPLNLVNNHKLTNRLTGVVIDNIKNWQSPKWMSDRLENAGMRSLNAVVDITNYVMLTTGHSCHVIDYDLIGKKNGVPLIKVRESRKGEKITTFDGKDYTLPGGDIVFEDGEGKLINLPGIIGLKNSVVSKNTKRVLFFFDNNNSARIRNTSMTLAIRTWAATLNEKNVDAELIPQSLALGLNLFSSICQTDKISKVYDIYPAKYGGKEIKTTKGYIQKLLGVEIKKEQIINILEALGFRPKWSTNELIVKIPSFRAHDIEIAEDIIEEIARIYGYHNLPSKLMAGELPEPVYNTPFKFENELRQTLRALGGVEILTLTLVPKDYTKSDALKLQNPLGSDTEYLRTTLKPSILKATEENSSINTPYHLFEIANVYQPFESDLPKENMMMGGVFVNYEYREAKGVLQALMKALNIEIDIELQQVGDKYIYEYELSILEKNKKTKKFTPLPKYPPQIEDITVEIKPGKPVGEVMKNIKNTDKLIANVELVDIYNNNHTFRVYYQHPEKTLSDDEVAKIRSKIEKFI